MGTISYNLEMETRLGVLCSSCDRIPLGAGEYDIIATEFATTFVALTFKRPKIAQA